MLPSTLDIVDPRPKGEDQHESNKQIRCGIEMRKEEIGSKTADQRIDQGLDEKDANAYHLTYGLDFSKHIRRHDRTACIDKHQTQGGDGELAEDDKQNSHKIDQNEYRLVLNAIDFGI